jgi:uncharacterized protein GlcG (DUF336 family)
MRIKKTDLTLGAPALKWTAGAVLAASLGGALVSCGGGGGGGTSGSGSSAPVGQTLAESATQVSPNTAAIDNFRLTQADVVTLLGRGVAAASARGINGTLVVVDRVGNVLAVYATDASDGVPAGCTGQTLADAAFFTSGEILISGGRNSVTSGLDNKSPCFPRGLYAIAKAVTGAYLSSSGNAFSTRTASLIVQEHFYPGVQRAPAGPLFGVQFSQLPCGDLVRDVTQDGLSGPKRSPLGLSADPGGFPIYKNGIVVGGIGFIKAGGTYGLDLDPTNRDDDEEEFVSYSALLPGPTPANNAANPDFRAPDSIRADRISAGGPFFKYSDTDGGSFAASTLANGSYRTVGGYYTAAPLDAASNAQIAVAYGQSGSGYRPLSAGDLGTGAAGNTTFQAIESRLISKGAYVLTAPAGANQNNRFVPRNSTNGVANDEISAADVALLLENAYNIAARGRAQIRTPLNSAIQVTISVVDRNGIPLGIVRTPDAPVFGTDVSLQKARSAVFMSKDIRSSLDAIQATRATPGRGFLPDVSQYRNVTGFATISTFDGSTAFSARGFGNFARPFWPDGLESEPRGPFSRNFPDWSPFSTGLQLDMAFEKIATNLTSTGVARSQSCMPDPSGLTPNTVPELPARNGLQIFAGGFPLYRGSTMIGGIGISGDGIDQDDMIAFLGVRNAAQNGANIAHAPSSSRIDSRATLDGKSARYVNCPFKPFTDSDETNPCEGI